MRAEFGGKLEYRYELRYDVKPWTVNAERSFSHWSERSEVTKMWRNDFKLLAKQAKIPQLQYARIEVPHPCKPDGRRKPPDPVACAGAAKAAIDGVVDAGVLPDDNGEYLYSVEFFAPEPSDRDGLILILEDLSKCSEDDE